MGTLIQTRDLTQIITLSIIFANNGSRPPGKLLLQVAIKSDRANVLKTPRKFSSPYFPYLNIGEQIPIFLVFYMLIFSCIYFSTFFFWQYSYICLKLRSLYLIIGLPWQLSGKESACQCRRCGFFENQKKLIKLLAMFFKQKRVGPNK